MVNTLIKLFLLVWVVFTSYWLLPLKKPKQYRPDSEANTIVATQQFCESPCADIIIKKGRIIVPDSIAKNYHDVRTDVARITGSSPFKKSKRSPFGSVPLLHTNLKSGYLSLMAF